MMNTNNYNNELTVYMSKYFVKKMALKNAIWDLDRRAANVPQLDIYKCALFFNLVDLATQCMIAGI